MSAHHREAPAPTPVQASHRARLSPVGRKVGFCRQYDADLITFEIIAAAACGTNA